jgi:hypothetical protein
VAYEVWPDPDDPDVQCTCCAGAPGVRGDVRAAGAPVAAYFAEPAGMPKHPALRLGLVMGLFTDRATADDRRSVVFICRLVAGELRIAPGEPYLPTFPELVQLGRPTQASALEGDDVAAMQAMAAAVIAQDPRLAEMRGEGARRRHRFAAEA